jgi:hypothetical protein
MIATLEPDPRPGSSLDGQQHFSQVMLIAGDPDTAVAYVQGLLPVACNVYSCWVEPLPEMNLTPGQVVPRDRQLSRPDQAGLVEELARGRWLKFTALEGLKAYWWPICIVPYALDQAYRRASHPDETYAGIYPR